jgi:hypothetical protein
MVEIMSIKSSLTDLGSGIVRSWKQLVAHVVTTFSVLFTLVTAVDFFVPAIKIKTSLVFGLIALASLLHGLRKVWKPSKIEICVATCATRIEVVFADLFKQNGVRAIAVNEYFDSQLGRPVSPNSLHGKLITNCFGGHPQPFDAQLATELAGLTSTVEPLKVEGKNVKYAIGTTAMVQANADQYLLFALTHSDPITCKASADVTMLWSAVNALWKRARVECNGDPLNVPLIGSGPSGLGLPTRDLLNLIILSAVTETKAREITKRIRIILHRDRFDDLDLREVKKHWEEK